MEKHSNMPNKIISKLAHIDTLKQKSQEISAKNSTKKTKNISNEKSSKSCKNLLAFSGGSDSVALFFLLLKNRVEFDIAIIDYGVREQSKAEVKYALALAKTYHKQCFVKKCPKIKSNFEANAREFRYEFFEKLIARLGYENLLLAHHFNDRVEWLLMQLGKGAGLGTMLGFESLEKRQKGLVKKSVSYAIIRPMLLLKKSEILGFCKELGLKFFEDSSNTDSAYKRNFVRMRFANEFVECFGKGLQKSFAILEGEKNALYSGEIKDFGGFCVISAKNTLEALHCIDRLAKQCGYVLSFSQREEIVRCGFSCEVGRQSKATRIAKNHDTKNHTKNILIKSSKKTNGFMLENITSIFSDSLETQSKMYIFMSVVDEGSGAETLPKDFREFARKSHIPKKMRKPLYAFSLQKKLKYQDALESIIKQSY